MRNISLLVSHACMNSFALCGRRVEARRAHISQSNREIDVGGGRENEEKEREGEEDEGGMDGWMLEALMQTGKTSPKTRQPPDVFPQVSHLSRSPVGLAWGLSCLGALL